MPFRMRKWKIKNIGNEEYISVNGKIANPLNPKKKESVEFLVDTGASGCAIPSELAEKLDLQKMGYVDAGLADGSVKRVKATYILVEVAGKKLYTWTIYDKGFTPIIGLDVMWVLGVHIDVPNKNILVPFKGLNIKKLRITTGLHKVRLPRGGGG